ncbi:Methionine adenosyltransferase 2 subunit beta [Metarhizium anisopliae]|nr:Methionine adenosyltransferase 2 subunit beta [Metarhizium anisopliae]
MASNGQRTALVTGATGLLGREITAAFRQSPKWDVKGTGYSRADGVDILKVNLENEDLNELNTVLDETQPHVIVHSAAQRFPDRVDKDPEGARSLNIAASRRLAQVALSRDILLIYISTDYVFPGIPGDAPYEADATPKPTNLYGQTKFDGERAILEEAAKVGKPGSAIVLRVPVLYGHAETPAESAVNVLMDSVWKAQTEGANIKMDHWAVRYPTNTEDIGRVLIIPTTHMARFKQYTANLNCALYDLVHDPKREVVNMATKEFFPDIAAKYLDANGPDHRKALPSIVQFSSEDKMTKYEICQLFGKIMGLDTSNIEANAQGNDPNAAVQRPYDCHLSTKALRDLGIDISTCNFVDWWRREIRAFSK